MSLLNGDLGILQRFLGGDAVPRPPPKCSSHLTSLLPFYPCSRSHYHPVWGGAGFTLPGVMTLERAEREGQAWPPGTEALASCPPLRPAHLETVLLASRPSGMHRYLIRPPPPSLPAPHRCSGGPRNLVPNDYVQIGDDGCCCCCFVVVCERCDAVCPRGQLPPSPSLGLSPLSAVGTTSVLTPWDCLPLPSLSLPAWGTHVCARACARAHARTHTHTHLTSHACFTF